MNLYDFITLAEKDFDTYDTEYDGCVTVCCPYRDENPTDDYDVFCNSIMKKVDAIGPCANGGLVVNWSDLIKRNMEKFKAFTKENWWKNRQYDDDEDEFIYQWITEIHYYMAGYMSDGFYTKLVKLMEDLN